MKKTVIEIDSNQLLNALERLPTDDIKKIIDTLILKGLFKKPSFTDVSMRTRKVVKRKDVKPEVVEDAVKKQT